MEYHLLPNWENEEKKKIIVNQKAFITYFQKYYCYETYNLKYYLEMILLIYIIGKINIVLCPIDYKINKYNANLDYRFMCSV